MKDASCVATQRSRRHQRGIVTLEFVMMVMLGILPLLLATYSAVTFMAVQQTLTIASSEGARASMRSGSDAQRRAAACEAARRSMEWLLVYSGEEPGCSSASDGPIRVSRPVPCSSLEETRCIHVVVSYDHARHPLVPGTGNLYRWALGRPVSSGAVAQLDMSSK